MSLSNNSWVKSVFFSNFFNSMVTLKGQDWFGREYWAGPSRHTLVWKPKVLHWLLSLHRPALFDRRVSCSEGAQVLNRTYPAKEGCFVLHEPQQCQWTVSSIHFLVSIPVLCSSLLSYRNRTLSFPCCFNLCFVWLPRKTLEMGLEQKFTAF